MFIAVTGPLEVFALKRQPELAARVQVGWRSDCYQAVANAGTPTGQGVANSEKSCSVGAGNRETATQCVTNILKFLH